MAYTVGYPWEGTTTANAEIMPPFLAKKVLISNDDSTTDMTVTLYLSGGPMTITVKAREVFEEELEVAKVVTVTGSIAARIWFWGEVTGE